MDQSLKPFCGDISARSSFSSYCFRFACHALCICHLSVYSTLGFGDGDQGLWCTMPVGFSLGINDRISPYTDVKLPHYRSGTWTYTRGVLATMDRPFLGWQGRFFLHNVAHFHVVHHFFPKIPFYHVEEATSYLKQLLGPDYHFSDQPVFESL